MALIPFLLGESFEDLTAAVVPSLLQHHSDNMGSHRRHSVGPVRSGHHLHPWRHTPLLTHFMHHHDAPLHPRRHSAKDHAKHPGAFKVNVDVQQFKPEEIDVKVVDGFIVVAAKHEERMDEHGYIMREFKRRYKLPDDVDVDFVTSKLSSDGILCIEAPRKSDEPPSTERHIPIMRTHAPAVVAQPHEEIKKGDKGGENGETMDQ